MSCKQRTDLIDYIKELEAAGKYEEARLLRSLL